MLLFTQKVPPVQAADDELPSRSQQASTAGTCGTSTSHFRGDIEALRGIAVIFVVMYHIFPINFAGGFVGVDCFFVISGFVISLLTSKWLAKDTFTLTRFYAMRFRRLLPASTVLVLVVLAFCLVFEPACITVPIAKEAVAAATFRANYFFLSQDTDYDANHERPSPFLHFWSLAAEEQFYFVFPLLIMSSKWIGHKASTGLIACLACASFMYSVYLSFRHQKLQAFYSIESRWWEMAAGCLLFRFQERGSAESPAPNFSKCCACIDEGSSSTNSHREASQHEQTPQNQCCSFTYLERFPTQDEVLSFVGAAVLCCSLLGSRLDAWFPGPGALPAVLGTCMLLLAGQEAPLNQWLASNTILRRAGKFSYSIYLWHWPVIVLGRYGVPGVGGFMHGALIVLLLAILSFRAVENPLRKISSVKHGLLVGVVCVAVSSVTARLAQEVVASSPPGLPVPNTLEAIQQLPFNATLAFHMELLQVSAGSASDIPGNLSPPFSEPARGYTAWNELKHCAVKSCTFSAATGSWNGAPQDAPAIAEQPLRMLLVGDSHAAHWFLPLHRVARHFGFEVEVRYANGCPFTQVTQSSKEPYRIRGELTPCGQFVLDTEAAALEADLIVISRYVDETQHGTPSPTTQKTLHQYRSMHTRSRSNHTLTWVIGDTAGSPNPCSLEQVGQNIVHPPRPGVLKADQIMQGLNDVQGMFYTPSVPLLCASQPTGPQQWTYACPSVLGNVMVGVNADHMSGPMSAYLAEVVLNFMQVAHPPLWQALCHMAAVAGSGPPPLGCL